ncbi:unnamed protein product, partial [Arabidopsis halleri]
MIKKKKKDCSESLKTKLPPSGRLQPATGLVGKRNPAEDSGGGSVTCLGFFLCVFSIRFNQDFVTDSIVTLNHSRFGWFININIFINF